MPARGGAHAGADEVSSRRGAGAPEFKSSWGAPTPDGRPNTPVCARSLADPVHDILRMDGAYLFVAAEVVHVERKQVGDVVGQHRRDKPRVV